MYTKLILTKQSMLFHILLFVSVVVNINAHVKISSGVILRRLPHAALQEASAQFVLELDFNFKKAHMYCNQCNFSVNCKSLFSINIEPDNLPTNRSILDDEGTGTFSHWKRSHLTHMFVQEQEIARLKKQLQNRTTSFPLYIPKNMSTVPPSCLQVNEAWAYMLQLHHRANTLLSACQTRRLSLDIFSQEEMGLLLQRTQRILSKRTQLVPIFMEAAKYYDNPVAECVISNTITLVGVHIPLQRKSTKSYELYEILTPSFYGNGQLCRTDVGLNMVALSTNHSLPPLMPVCTPYEDDVCTLNTLNTDVGSSQLECIKSVWREETASQIADKCAMKCQPRNSSESMVTSISRNQFIITQPPTTLYMQCSNQTLAIHQPYVTGAIEASIPCGCSLFPVNNATFQSAFRCKEQPSQEDGIKDQMKFEILLPAAWYSGINIVIHSNGTTVSACNNSYNCVNFPSTIEASIVTVNNSVMHYCIEGLLLLAMGLSLWYLHLRTKAPRKPPRRDRILMHRPVLNCTCLICVPKPPPRRVQVPTITVNKEERTPSHNEEHLYVQMSRDPSYLEPRQTVDQPIYDQLNHQLN